MSITKLNFTELEILQHEIHSTLLGMEFNLRWSKDTSLEMETRLGAAKSYDNLCNQLRLKVRQLINLSIKENSGIYEELLQYNRDELIAEIKGDDEIRAYLATYRLCEDLENRFGYTDISPITELHEAANKWCARSNFRMEWGWSMLFKSIESHKTETEYELTCQECGCVFDTKFELNCHIGVRSTNVGLEEFCEIEPDYDKYDDVPF